MGSLNKCLIIGNAGRDCELRYTPNGTAVSDFSVAVNTRRKSQSGDWEDETEWFNVVLFGDQAERISQYVTKGKQVYVEGRMRTRNWDDDNGERHYRTELLANTVQFLGTKEGSASTESVAAAPAAPAERKEQTYDDLPFE